MNDDKIVVADTAEEMIKAWDDGKTVFSLRFDGPSPSAEQSAQICMIEFLRDHFENAHTSEKQWDALCNETFKRLKPGMIGLDDNLIHAAKWMSLQFARLGPKGALEKILEKGNSKALIAITRKFPIWNFQAILRN
jgi:hypothetical protein